MDWHVHQIPWWKVMYTTCVNEQATQKAPVICSILDSICDFLKYEYSYLSSYEESGITHSLPIKNVERVRRLTHIIPKEWCIFTLTIHLGKQIHF